MTDKEKIEALEKTIADLKSNEVSGKIVSHYQVMLEAFIGARNEVDRQILTISVSALGFLLTFSEKLSEGSCVAKMGLVIACSLFLLNVPIIFSIMRLNANYISCEISDDETGIAKLSNPMIILDFLARTFLFAGFIISTALFLTLIYGK